MNDILQPLIFSMNQFESLDQELLFHSSGHSCRCYSKSLWIDTRSEINFHSYFNAFSCKKWCLYSGIRNVGLKLRMRGKAEVILYHNRMLYGANHNTVLSKHLIETTEDQWFTFSLREMKSEGVYSFKIRTYESTCILQEGYYVSIETVLSAPVKLAVLFTTYHRHQYILENITNIKTINNPNIHTYIIDNGSDLVIEPDQLCTIIPNNNMGGAGGFARGMMQIIDEQSYRQFTHCIVIDDDAMILPEILERLMLFLTYLKPEYRDAFVGGAMLRKDITWYQYENGGIWNRGDEIIHGHGWDLRDPITCLKNELNYTVQYNAWWFCTIPIQYIRNDNLPLPVFYLNDDVDFGIRNRAHVITMNGICVWHDAFDSKQSASRCYYDNRNKLIVNSVHGLLPPRKKLLKRIWKDIRTEFCLYRFENACAILDGVIDFLKGPDWLIEIEADKYNQQIQERNRHMEPLRELGEDTRFDYDWYRTCCTIKDVDRKHKLVRYLTCNGLLLSANRFLILPPYAGQPVQGYRAAEILYYDEITGRGYLCRKNKAEIMNIVKRYLQVKKALKRSYETVVKEYKEAYPRLIYRETWERYLRL